MKKLLLAIICFFVLSPAFVQAQDQGELIRQYKVHLTVNQDSSVGVREDILYDFGDAQRHGIFRTIPYRYSGRGGIFKLRYSNISVTNESGVPYQFETSNVDGELQLKIGNPDSYVTGVNLYRITYKVDRAINYFDDHDELYWNAIGSKWTVPILGSVVIVTMPSKITKQTCFVGPDGTTDTSGCQYNQPDSKSVMFVAQKAISPGEGFTTVTTVNKGVVFQPSTWQIILFTIRDNWILGLPVLVFLIMFCYGILSEKMHEVVALLLLNTNRQTVSPRLKLVY